MSSAIILCNCYVICRIFEHHDLSLLSIVIASSMLLNDLNILSSNVLYTASAPIKLINPTHSVSYIFKSVKDKLNKIPIIIDIKKHFVHMCFLHLVPSFILCIKEVDIIEDAIEIINIFLSNVIFNILSPSIYYMITLITSTGSCVYRKNDLN